MNVKEGVVARIPTKGKRTPIKQTSGPNILTPNPPEVTAMEEGDMETASLRSNTDNPTASGANASGQPPLPPLWGEDVLARASALETGGKTSNPKAHQGSLGNATDQERYRTEPSRPIFRFLIRNLMSLSLIIFPREDPTSKGQKRGRHDGSPNSVDFPVKRRKDDQLVIYFNFAQKERGSRVQVKDIGCISAHFRNEIDKLQGSLVVRMGGISIKRGYGRIQCDNMETFTWASGIVTTMGNGGFKICSEDEVFYSTHSVGMWIRERERPDPAFLFPAISKQNGGFDTSKWRLVSAQSTKGGQFLLVEMDAESYAAIQPPAKLYYYMDRLNFKFNPTKKPSHRK